MNRGIIIAIIIVFFVGGAYSAVFYPRQSMPYGKEISVETPERYHNDCLHPCIRVFDDRYFLSQSPYYSWNSKYENPLFYQSDNETNWRNGIELQATPSTGYNSDPNIIVDGKLVYYVWRECGTPLCDSLHCREAIVGGYVLNDKLDMKRMLATNTWVQGDYTQSPTLSCKHNNEGGKTYFIYSAWYQYEPERINKGTAIWESNSLDNPDFHIIDTIRYANCYTVDQIKQIKIGNKLYFIPKHQKHDLWHFDLFEYNNRLWMVSVAEKGDNIMLSVSEDYHHFKTFFMPLINNHYSETNTGYRQYYYKPTAFVRNDTLFLYYTANAKDDPKRNQLFLSKKPMSTYL